MKTINIPNTVELKSGTYTGKYIKRPGSQRDSNLFCWFNEEGDDHFPHASIDISSTHLDWEYFHVTYPVMRKKVWSEELERVSYSVHVRIDRESDQISVTKKTTTQGWQLPDTPYNALGFADMDRKAFEFAKEFYSAAFFQATR
ncbi:hypothetical protein ACFOLC_03495 [Lysobacter cavernae]|uniref:Uncharacterized protein n=1 Tax=Lysobacter cavernae TaxID=1685901 RepID=A0ABV7RN63_9GAMM